MLLQWQKGFERGQPDADAEHRQIVDLLNELDVCLDSGMPPETIDRALDCLAHVLARHLEAEHVVTDPQARQARRVYESWRNGDISPNRQDLRILAHWWLSRLCQHQTPGDTA